MANLCETCPLRGDCVSNIAAVANQAYVDTEYPWFKRPIVRNINIVQLTDTDGNQSELFQGVDSETLIERLEDCPGPYERTTITGLWQRQTDEQFCGALNVRPDVALLYAFRFKESERRELEKQVEYVPTRMDRLIRHRYTGRVLIGAGSAFILAFEGYDWEATHSTVGAVVFIGSAAVGVAGGTWLSQKAGLAIMRKNDFLDGLDPDENSD